MDETHWGSSSAEVGNEQWSDVEEKKEVSVDDIKALASQLDDLDVDHKKKDKAAKEAKVELESVRGKLVAMLQEAGLDKFHVPGIGTISVSYTPTIKTPKTFEDKAALFSWLKEQGKDMYLTYASVNSQSLNSLYKLEAERHALGGEVFTMPGCEMGATREKLSFRRGK